MLKAGLETELMMYMYYAPIQLSDTSDGSIKQTNAV